ncbi:MAG: hypothetical protein CM1200mP26_25710 [Acidimicrobiales bacterium]|nr:MAG: hypothetical protein CM1200mP26_25710 [Acidimicrobiales bacterium]
MLQVGFLDWDNFAPILRALWSSTKVAMIGLGIAICIGFVLGTLMSQAKIVERAIFPFAVTLQAIPILAIVPPFLLLVRNRSDVAGRGLRDHFAFPDHHEHPVRAAVG